MTTVECFQESENREGNGAEDKGKNSLSRALQKRKQRPLAPKAVFVFGVFFFEKEVHVLRFVGLFITRVTTNERLAKVGKEIPT